MKKLLPFAFALLALAGCSKNDSSTPAPSTPTLTGGTWAWTSETTVATSKSTGAVISSQAKTVIPNTVKGTYATDGTYTVVLDKSVTTTGMTQTSTSAYTYSAGTITYTNSGKTSTARVDVLTNSNLTLVATSEDSSTRYVTTDTFTR